MRHLEGLNPRQLEAVKTIEGPLLVLAGAGTGKTKVVTCRIAEIVSKGTPPPAVCAVTFTNKAANEMRERASKVLGLKRGAPAPVVSTFHSLGVRLLREYGSRIGIPKAFVVADDADQQEIVTDCLRDLGVGRDQLQPKEGRWRISGWKNQGLSPEDALEAASTPLDEKIAWAYSRYEEEVARRNLVDFDDLILKPLRLLEKHEEVQVALMQRFRYLLVDEYQDTNGVQYRLVKLMTGHRQNVCVVGDDDQSIYGWRGAEPDRILTFARDFRGAKTVILDQNYRSTNIILNAANRVIANNRARKEKKLWSALGQGDPIRLYVATDEKDEIAEVGRTVARLLKVQSVPPNDVAVLFRANRMCRPLEQAFRERAIPYKVVGTRSFFDRREVRDLLAYCRVAANPKDDGAWIRVANTPPRGIGKGSIDKLKTLSGEARAPLREVARTRAAEFNAKIAEGLANFEAALAAVVEESGREGVAVAIERLANRIQYRDFLKMDTPDPLELANRLTGIEDLLKVAKDFEEKASDRSLAPFLEALALQDDDRFEKNDDRPQVALLTMHAAKGLEFPYVFVVGCEEGILPHKNSVAEADEDDPDAKLDQPEKGLEEERRLFYVALTRAKRKLTLTYSAKRTKFGKEENRVRSRFLDEMGDEGVELVDANSDEPAPKEFGKAMLADLKARFARPAEGAK